MSTNAPGGATGTGEARRLSGRGMRSASTSAGRRIRHQRLPCLDPVCEAWPSWEVQEWLTPPPSLRPGGSGNAVDFLHANRGP